jgi:hypothetical protein
MVGHCEAAHRGMTQNNIASRLVIHFLSDLLEGFDCILPELDGTLLMQVFQLLLRKSATAPARRAF